MNESRDTIGTYSDLDGVWSEVHRARSKIVVRQLVTPSAAFLARREAEREEAAARGPSLDERIAALEAKIAAAERKT